MARYEAGDENSNVVSKQNITVYTNKRQKDFEIIGKAMYGEDSIYVKSAMCSGIQWDMIMKFIDGKIDGNGESYDVKIANSNRHKGSDVGIEETGNNIADKVQNIYDLEGNCWEYIAERTNKTFDAFVGRGGSYGNYSTSTASLRNSNPGGSMRVTFRLVLYVK